MTARRSQAAGGGAGSIHGGEVVPSFQRIMPAPCSRPSGNSTFPPTAPASGCASAAATSASIQPGSISASS